MSESVEDVVRFFFVETGKAIASGGNVSLTAAQAKVIRARLMAFGFMKGSIQSTLNDVAEREAAALEG